MLSVLDDPSRIFNGDETGFLLNPKTGKVLAEKGVRNVNEIDKACAKSSITVMFTCSAAGDMCPPMVLYPYKRLPAIVAKSVPDSWGIGLTESGWMVAEAFYEYMANVLIPHFKVNCKLPVILFLDEHRSHLSLHLSNLCRDAGVILVSLYPNATRVIQPCDVSVFKGLKTEWKKAVSMWYTRNLDGSLTKEHFAPVLKWAMDEIKREWIINGFRKTGLCPWNPFAFDENLCLGTTSKLTEPPLTATISYGQFKAVVGNAEVDRLLKGRATHQESNTLRNLIRSFKVNPEETASVEGSDVLSDHDQCDVIPTESIDLEVRGNVLETNVKLGEVDIPESSGTAEQGNGETESPISEVLFWPATPKRKCKRQTERVPFVMTSLKWKEIADSKDRKKKQLALEKEERKRKREECKKQKEELRKKKLKEKKKAKSDESDMESEDDSLPSLHSSSGGSGFISDEEEPLALPPVIKVVGAYVAVRYDSNVFPGIITEIREEGAVVKSMKRLGQLWKWPERDDVLFYDWEDIIGGLKEPTQFSTRREIYSIPILEQFY